MSLNSINLADDFTKLMSAGSELFEQMITSLSIQFEEAIDEAIAEADTSKEGNGDADEPIFSLREVHDIVAGALYDFTNYVNLSDTPIIGWKDSPSDPLDDAVADFISIRNVHTEAPDVDGWQDTIAL